MAEFNVQNEAAIEAAIRKVEQMLDAARNGNQHGENAIVAAASGLDLLSVLNRFHHAYGWDDTGLADCEPCDPIGPVTAGDLAAMKRVIELAEGRS